MSPTVIVRFGALVAAAGLMFGQGRGSTSTTTAPTGGTSGTSTGTAPTTTPSPSRTPSTTPNPQQTTQQPQMQQPIFLSGRVQMEDGSPASNVVIERVCS